MKTFETIYRNTSSVYLIVLVFLMTGMGCSKDDGPDPVTIVKSAEKELNSFKFLAADNTTLTIDVTATIDETAKTTTTNLPSDTPLTALTPTIAISAKASINPQGEQDFTNPVTYTVTAEDGSTKSYSVSASSKTSAKQITSFVFLLTTNAIDIDVVATIDEENKTITATMPVGTVINDLLPEVQVSELATIDHTTAQNFTEPIEYTVTAEDGSEVIYTVTITSLLSQRQILQTILDVNPANTLDWDLQNTINLNDLDGVTTNTEERITNLELEEASLEQLPKKIGLLNNLEGLFVGSNQLESIPAEIGNLTSLITLDLYDNQLDGIPSEIEKLINLKHLNVSSNNLNKFPSVIGLLNGLGDLNLSSNNISAIPIEIGQLINLSLFSIADNNINELPLEIGKLTNLQYLKLSGNKLDALPIEIGLLTKLQDLLLSENELNSIPPEIGFLTNLNTLNLSNNNLTSIPNSITALTDYNNLNLSVGVKLLVPLPSQKDALISIYSANPESTLEWSVDNYPDVDFNQNNNATSLRISNKNISRLPFFIGHLTSLDIIIANNNKIGKIPASLGSTNLLVVLEFGNNQLTTLPATLGQLSNLASLNITNNPIISIPNEVCDLQISNGGILTILTDTGEGCN